MPVIALQGIRGGVGTTSLVAGLAWALQRLNESVLVIDFSPTNQLRLHCNLPFSKARGWARNEVDGLPWEDSALRYTSLFDFIPFGDITSLERAELEKKLRKKNNPWPGRLSLLQHYQWILLDLPAEDMFFASIGADLTTNNLMILNPDMNCHVRIHQQELSPSSHFVINQYHSSRPIQQDLILLWQQTLPHLAVTSIHKDEAVAEAMAMMQPIGEYYPESMAAKEINALASWCIVHLSEKKS